MESFFIETLRFDRVIKTENPDSEQMEHSFSEINKLLKMAHTNATKSTLLSVYYTGHGVLEYTTKIVLNEAEPLFRYFDLEQKLSSLSKMDNNFIHGVFDCCREELPRSGTKDIGDTDDRKNLTNQNLFVVFGCPPRTGVPAESTIVKSYIECVTDYLNKTGGVLQLPAALDFRFKAKFEKTSTERREVTKQLFYDTSRAEKKDESGTASVKNANKTE